MKELKNLFANNALHDYELVKMLVDHPNGTIILNLISDKLEAVEIVIDNFKSINFSKREPWGKGKYIVSGDVKKSNGEWILELQLNSGDICTVVFV